MQKISQIAAQLVQEAPFVNRSELEKLREQCVQMEGYRPPQQQVYLAKPQMFTVCVSMEDVLRESAKIDIEALDGKKKHKAYHRPAPKAKAELLTFFRTLHDEMKQIWTVSLQCLHLAIARSFERQFASGQFTSPTFNAGIMDNLQDILRRIMQSKACTSYRLQRDKYAGALPFENVFLMQEDIEFVMSSNGYEVVRRDGISYVFNEMAQ